VISSTSGRVAKFTVQDDHVPLLLKPGHTSWWLVPGEFKLRSHTDSSMGLPVASWNVSVLVSASKVSAAPPFGRLPEQELHAVIVRVRERALPKIAAEVAGADLVEPRQFVDRARVEDAQLRLVTEAAAYGQNIAVGDDVASRAVRRDAEADGARHGRLRAVDPGPDGHAPSLLRTLERRVLAGAGRGIAGR